MLPVDGSCFERLCLVNRCEVRLVKENDVQNERADPDLT